MSVAETIRTKLAETFAPSALDVVDESHMHRGHVGARPGGETHIRVFMTAAAFEGLSRVERQRRVYDALAEELAGPVHALALKLDAPAPRDA